MEVESDRSDRISIHAPRVGSDLVFSAGADLMHIFQSTLPVWGATAEILNKSPAKRDKEQE